MISEYEFPTVGQIAHAQELRGAEVVHVRPGPDGSISAERFAEAIDERTALVCCTTISYRTGHRHDVAAIAAARARERRARARRQLPGGRRDRARRRGRSGSTSSPAGRSSTCSPRPASASSGVRPELFAGAPADADRLVRRRGHLPDGHLRLLARTDAHGASTAGTPPVPNIYAGVAGIVDRRRRPACRRSRRTSAGSTPRLIDGLEELGGDRRRRRAEPGAARPARLRPLDRVDRARRARSPTSGSSSRSRDDNLRVAPTSTTPRTTSMRSSPRSRRHRAAAWPRWTECQLVTRHVHRLAARAAVHRLRRSPRPGREPAPSGGARAGRGPVSCSIHGGFWRTGWDRTLMTPLAVDLARARARRLEHRVPARRPGGRRAGPGRSRTSPPRLDRLAAVDDVDATRVATCGHSAGGHLALWLAARHRLPAGAPGAAHARRPVAAVSQAGVTRSRPRRTRRARLWSVRGAARPARTTNVPERYAARLARGARAHSACPSSSSTAARTTSCPHAEPDPRRADPRAATSSPRSTAATTSTSIDAGHPAWRDTVGWLSRCLTAGS